jgi:hypothetical protein
MLVLPIVYIIQTAGLEKEIGSNLNKFYAVHDEPEELVL